MTDTTLDAAIEAAGDAVVEAARRTYARALIAKLLEGMDGTKCKAISPYLTLEAAADIGYNAALNDLRKIAGLEVKS